LTREAQVKKEIEELGKLADENRRMSRRRSIEETWRQWQSIEDPQDAVSDLQREVDALAQQQQALETQGLT